MSKYKVKIEKVTVEEAEFTLEVPPEVILEDVDWGEMAETAIAGGFQPSWS